MNAFLFMERSCESRDLRMNRRHFGRRRFVDRIGLAIGRGVFLCARQPRLFAIAESLLSVRLVRHETEGARHFLVEKVALPALRTGGLGTAGDVANVVLDIGLETRPAKGELAVGAFGGKSCRFVVVVTTEGTGVGHRCEHTCVLLRSQFWGRSK